jgi:hypothetical protein
MNYVNMLVSSGSSRIFSTVIMVLQNYTASYLKEQRFLYSLPLRTSYLTATYTVFEYFSFHLIVHWDYGMIITVILYPFLSVTEYVAMFSGYIYKIEDT